MLWKGQRILSLYIRKMLPDIGKYSLNLQRARMTKRK